MLNSKVQSYKSKWFGIKIQLYLLENSFPD
jgi:hypothetical protein